MLLNITLKLKCSHWPKIANTNINIALIYTYISILNEKCSKICQLHTRFIYPFKTENTIKYMR